jgi:hypothetical protein
MTGEAGGFKWRSRPFQKVAVPIDEMPMAVLE